MPSSGAPQNLVAPDRSLHPEGLNLHAASLRHAFAHCGRFVTAAPRRSLGSVSVPMWLAVLSDQLRVVALVGRYPHQLADTKSPAPGPVALWAPADACGGHNPVLPGLSAGCPGARGTLAIHYSPVRHWARIATGPVRLACLSHAASVQAEPGSNSSIGFRDRSDRSPDPKVGFPGRVDLETSLTVTRSSRRTNGWVSAPRRLGRDTYRTAAARPPLAGQRRDGDPSCFARLELLSYWLCSRELIKERSLLY